MICSDRDEEEMLSLHIVNGTLPSIPEGNFLRNAKVESLALQLISQSLTLVAYFFQCVSMLVFKCSPAMSLVLSLIPVYSMLPLQRIPPVRP